MKNQKKNRHHLKPRSRGGCKIESNLLTIDMRKHNAWHILFGNLTLNEVIRLLERVRSAKRNQMKTLKIG